MTAVNPADRPKSVRNRCLIEVFGGVFYVVTLLFGFFCGCRGFCHRTESDLFLFLFVEKTPQKKYTLYTWFTIFSENLVLKNENRSLMCHKSRAGARYTICDATSLLFWRFRRFGNRDEEAWADLCLQKHMACNKYTWTNRYDSSRGRRGRRFRARMTSVVIMDCTNHDQRPTSFRCPGSDCCGDYPYQHCCILPDFGIAVLVAVLVVLALVAAIACYRCCKSKRHRGRVIVKPQHQGTF